MYNIILILFMSIALGACKHVTKYEPREWDMSSQNKAEKLVSKFPSDEMERLILIPITGYIPQWIKGTYVRTGLMPVSINDKSPHWFDEPGMLQSFLFENGKVYYSNKFLRSDAYNKIFKEKNFNYVGFATQRNSILLDNIKLAFNFKKSPYIQNANVNVSKIGNEYVSLTETPLPVRFDINSLGTLGVLNWQDKLPKKNIFESAHIHYDMEADEQINYLVKYAKESHYILYRLKESKREIISEIAVKEPAYMHTFALTKNYIILVEFPFVINPTSLLFNNKPFIHNFTWEPKRGTNFLIIDRREGKLIKRINYDKAFFSFHHVNAYEENSKIIIDIITYPNPKIISNISHHGDLQLSYASQEKVDTKIMRYTLTLLDNDIKEEVVLDVPIEFPRINDSFNTKKYSYLYAVDPRLLSSGDDIRPIYKINIDNGQKAIWQESGVLPGEPIFIQDPQSNQEDAGVIISIVLDVNKKQTFLLVLDSKSLKEIGRVYVPQCLPSGLHGQFFKN